MFRGTVTFYDEERGFGFIMRDDRQPDIFLHVTGIADRSIKSIPRNARVEFHVVEGRDGKLQATGVVMVASQPIL